MGYSLIPIRRMLLILGFGVAVPIVNETQPIDRSTLPHTVVARYRNAEECDAGISAAQAALGTFPGIVEVGEDCTISKPLLLSPGHSLEFIRAGTYRLRAPIDLGDNSSISGLPNASDDSPVKLLADRGIEYMIRLGNHSVLRGLLLDGNHVAQDGVLVRDANRVHISDVTIHNASRDDLHVTSSSPQWNSGSGYLGPNVLLGNAGRDAMFIERSADWIVGAQVEFESGGRDGLHGEDSATLRCNGCDFGGNGRYGAASITVGAKGFQSSGWIIVGSQFGNNKQGDFYADGKAGDVALNGVHTLTGNGFIQSHAKPNTYNSITLLDAGGCTISGNTWGFVQPSWASTYKYIVYTEFQRLSIKQNYRNTITGNNVLPGTYGTGVFRLDRRDITAGNAEGDGPSVLRNVTIAN